MSDNREELLAKARSIAPALADQVEADEANGTLTAKTVALLEDAGMFRLKLPRELGGHEADPATQILVLEELARALGLSGRSLQRPLADEDTSHRQVLEETRRRLALSALDHRSNSVAEVAFALGYEHPGSFIRAFREWTGQTPGAWRKERWEGEAGPGTSPKSP